MANQFTGTTFSGTYKDDYRDSDGYHKVLFNSGRALQGRELNQLQTILQKQVTRMADNIFMDGAAVSPKSSGANTDIADYIIVDSLNLSAGVTVESFNGTAFQTPPQSGTNGLQFQVSWVVDATADDQATLYGRYISYNQTNATSNDVQASPLVALEGDTLTAIGGSGMPTLTVYTQPAESTLLSVGLGVLFSLQSAEFYTQGHFVYVPKQTAVISKYEGLVDCEVGFEVVQDIVTVSDDVRLYDNQGSRPNLSAPGADRYRISMILNTRASVAEETSFVTFATVRSSKIVQIKEGNQDYNMIEKRMAQRHSATHGNFIVSDFVVQFRNADSAEKILYNIPGAMFGTPPLAYLDGYYLEHTQWSSFSAPKPLTTTTEVDQGMQVGYKNYITFDAPTDAAGDVSLGAFTTTLNQQENLSLLNSGGAVIGNTRLKSLVSRNTEDSDAYRMYLYDTKMIGSSNFRDVRKINSTGASTPGAVVGLEDSQLYIKDPSTSISLFEIPGGRVSSMLPTAITVQRFGTDTVDGNLKIVVSCGANEDLVDKGEWIIINTTQDKVDRVSSGNIDIVNNTGTITTTGTAGNVCHVYFYVTKSAPAHRTKVYKTETFTATRTSSGDPAGDVFEFTDLYDGVELLEALDGTIDYLEEVIFDGGQKDNFYGPIQLIPDGIGASVTTLTCKVGYFDHGTTGDYFSVNSYALRTTATPTLPLFDYGDIPTYISPISGEEYEMHDYIDFRPKLDPNANNMTATDRFDMPRDGDGIVYDVVFYNMRLDHIALTYGEDFKPMIVVNKGDEGQQAVPPTEYDKQMVLFDVLLPGNVKDQNDVRFNRRKYRGYKMSDVAELEERIANLEETVTLTAMEAEASNLVEVTEDGVIRSKTGFFIEDFSQGYAFTATSVQNAFIDDESFATSSMNEDLHTLNSKFNLEHVGFEYENTNFLPASRRPVVNANVVQKGELVMLDYQEVLDPSMKQEVISWRGPGSAYEEFGYYNVNPFNVFTGEGILALHPAVDNWSDTTRLPDKIVSASTITRKSGQTLYPRTVSYSRTQSKRYTGKWHIDPKTGRRQRAVFTLSSKQTSSQRQSVTTRKVGDSTVVTKIRDEVVLSISMPWMRQKRVFCHAKGLRSNHRYYMFFDGTPMSQWIKTRSKAEWLNDKAAGVQNLPLPSTNVNLTGHPTTSASAQRLVSDLNGELYFEMWIPNTSSISVPLSTRYSSENEWKSWYAQQKSAALTYGGKSAAQYDAIGWKFAAKQTEVKLLDISVDNANAKPLSTARSSYDANGTRRVRQNMLHSTRTLTYADAYYASSNPQPVGDPVVNVTGYYQYCDPLAQTFALAAANDVPGVFITKVDVFLRSAPAVGSQFENTAIQLQIRGTTSGVPERDSISNQHRVYKSASSVRQAISGMNKNNLSSVLARPVTFELEEPVFIRNGEEYAIVLLSDCDEYEAYVASTYDEVLGSTTKRVSKQPATGSLFLSQNGSTWTPKQNQDMAYRIYTAKFKPAGSANFYSQNAEKFLHNRPRSLTVDTLSNTRFRVHHANHGLGTGDSVGMENLPSGIYRGVADNVIQHAQNKVTDPDTQGYYVDLADPFGANSSATFTSKGGFGTSVIETNRAMSFSEATLDFKDELFDATKISYQGSFVTGMSHAEVGNTDNDDPRFDIDNVNTPLGNQVTHYFNKPRYLGNDDQVLKELDPLGGNTASVVVGANLSSTQSSTFGGPSGQSAIAAGYISDVSPIVDIQDLSMLIIDNVIDNQVDSDSEVAYPGVRNKPADWISETASLSGSSPSKHITKVVQLSQGSGGLRVFVDAYVPPLANITLYYRTGVTGDEDLYNKSWTKINSQNFPLKNTWVTNEETQQYSEYKYLVGGDNGDLPSFVSFQLKVVMKTSNSCQAPILKSIRSIALT